MNETRPVKKIPKDYFTAKQLDSFFTKPDWGKRLTFDINHAKEKYGLTNFLHAVISHIFSYQDMTVSQAITKLEQAGYVLKQSDMFPQVSLGGHFDNASLQVYIDYYEYMKERGFSMKPYLDEYRQAYHNATNPYFINYLIGEGVDLKFDSIISMARTVTNDNLEAISLMTGSESFARGLVGAGEWEKEQAMTDQAIQMVIDYLDSTLLEREQVQKLIDTLYVPRHKFGQYCMKHKLDINMFEERDYINATSPKPRDWFFEGQLKILDKLEALYQVGYVEHA